MLLQNDTDPNAEFNDNTLEHIQIQLSRSDGVLEELVESDNATVRTDGPDGFGGLWVDYDGTTVSVYQDARSSTIKPATPVVTAKVNLAELFSGRDVFVGFTSSTWQQADFQDIVGWTMTQ